jgi:hypothetical protein
MYKVANKRKCEDQITNTNRSNITVGLNTKYQYWCTFKGIRDHSFSVSENGNDCSKGKKESTNMLSSDE